MSLDPAHLRLERARHLGREAYVAGCARGLCPYAPGTAEREVWEAAYDLAHETRENLGELWRRRG